MDGSLRARARLSVRPRSSGSGAPGWIHALVGWPRGAKEQLVGLDFLVQYQRAGPICVDAAVKKYYVQPEDAREAQRADWMAFRSCCPHLPRGRVHANWAGAAAVEWDCTANLTGDSHCLHHGYGHASKYTSRVPGYSGYCCQSGMLSTGIGCCWAKPRGGWPLRQAVSVLAAARVGCIVGWCWVGKERRAQHRVPVGRYCVYTILRPQVLCTWSPYRQQPCSLYLPLNGLFRLVC
jgi:hypothetical protein